MRSSDRAPRAVELAAGPAAAAVDGELTGPSRARGEVAADVSGLLLFAACAAWTIIAGRAVGGRPGPTVDLVLVVAAAVALGRVGAMLHDRAVPLAVACWALLVALANADILLDGPLRSPLGYNNATAAFFVLGSAAGVMVAARSKGLARVAALGLAAAFATVPWLNGSLAGAALVSTLPLAAVAAWGRRAVRLLVVGAAVTVLAALLATVIMASLYGDTDRGGRLGRLVDATLTERRVVLWQDALTLMLRRPLFGVGPGRFHEASLTARQDQDAAWAHNAYLQMGAETGLVGFGLTVALVVWGFARLGWSPLDGATAAAALALAAVAIHASMDYILHFPQVPLAAGLLVGAGSSGFPVGRRPTGGGRRDA